MDITNAQRARVLVHALPYIQDYSGKIVVVKYGGNAMISEHLKDSVIRDICLLQLIGVKVVLVHGEEKAQQILSGLIKDQFHLSVYAPGYLEEMALAAGATPEVVVTAQPKSYAHVDWELLLEETEGKLSKLRTRLEKAGERPWDEQVDIRDRILELNKELLSVLTQL